MQPLKVVFLWHQHQPYYKLGNEFLMPWTRLHGVKDYFDLPEILYEYPKIKQTFNIVPSLNLQIDEYISEKVIDKVQYLTAIKANELDEFNKKEILYYFFMCNKANMIFANPRFKDLFDRSRDTEFALKNFSLNDWLDLQVWYNLAWFGFYSKEHSLIKRLLTKGENFTEDEKTLMMSHQIEILKQINNQLYSLMMLGQVEICCSPKYHPILPLLIDSHSALEAIPRCRMPEPIFKFPEDAEEQIKFGLEYTSNFFKRNTKGMWPSEGSISNATLDMFIRNKVQWVASDEQVLYESTKDTFQPTEKFFPRKYQNENGSIAIFFRDHYLSDRIAFVYSTWNPEEAAIDFCNSLRSIRNEIHRVHGEDGLNHAAIAIMLDGENCWEYYQDNGVPFLRELYHNLSINNEFETVTCSEASVPEHINYLPTLTNIRAGSWINANFAIWIGDEDDRKAWNMLSKARIKIEEYKAIVSKEQLAEAMEEVYIAEGSDWCWWYGPEHSADNRHQFDELFRWHIKRIYEILELDIPHEVFYPISDYTLGDSQRKPIKDINLYDDLDNEIKWNDCGFIDLKSFMSAMHQIGELVLNLNYAKFEKTLFLKLNLNKEFTSKDSIQIEIFKPFQMAFQYERNKSLVRFGANSNNIHQMVNLNDKCFILAIEFEDSVNFEENSIELKLKTVSEGNEINYPLQGFISLYF